jgi:hypothetical protein
MATHTPEPDDDREPERDADDIDARFAEITAGLGEITLPPAATEHGTTEDDGPDRSPSPVTGSQDDDAPAFRPDPGTGSTAPGPRDYAVAPQDEEKFEPPEPGPLSGGDPLVTLAWVGVVSPVVLVLVYLMLWRGMPAVLLGLGGVVFVLAIGTLVWRMPARRRPDDFDDGAVV